jgi:hypothetical protein
VLEFGPTDARILSGVGFDGGQFFLTPTDSHQLSARGGLRRHPRVLIEAIALALRVELALRRRSFDQVLADVTSTRPRPAARDVPAKTFERAVQIAYRLLPFESTCLKQSLVVCLFRRRRGLPTKLRIGVRKNGGEFAAHAWVEDGDGNVLTDPLEGFSPVPLPAGSATPDGKAND